jgi:hypothetical protein
MYHFSVRFFEGDVPPGLCKGTPAAWTRTHLIPEAIVRASLLRTTRCCLRGRVQRAGNRRWMRIACGAFLLLAACRDTAADSAEQTEARDLEMMVEGERLPQPRLPHDLEAHRVDQREPLIREAGEPMVDRTPHQI